MDPPKLEANFLKQARRGEASWRLQRYVAMGVVLVFCGAAAYTLWTGSQAGEIASAVMPVLMWLSLALAAAMWGVHSEVMAGAALHVERAESVPPPKP